MLHLFIYAFKALSVFPLAAREIWDLVTTVIIVLLDFSLTVKAATLIFISGCGSAISSAKEGKSGFIYNLVKS